MNSINEFISNENQKNKKEKKLNKKICFCRKNNCNTFYCECLKNSKNCENCLCKNCENKNYLKVYELYNIKFKYF